MNAIQPEDKNLWTSYMKCHIGINILICFSFSVNSNQCKRAGCPGDEDGGCRETIFGPLCFCKDGKEYNFTKAACQGNVMIGIFQVILLKSFHQWKK